MAKLIEIVVRDKIATYVGREPIICNNSDYLVSFSFDSEWDEYLVKTAKFILPSGKCIPIIFEGNVCPVPRFSKIRLLKIGVETDNVHTTTSANVPCLYSCTCDSGEEIPPPQDDVYAQIMEMLNRGSGSVTDEQIAEAIETYFAEHPADSLPVATDEEVAEAIDSIFGSNTVNE